MAIIYDNSTAGLQAKNHDQIKTSINRMNQSLRSIFEALFRDVWQNQDGLTPQQVFDAFGTDAKQLFDVANAAGTLLVTLNPAYAPPSPATMVPPKTYTINQNGTVTVN